MRGVDGYGNEDTITVQRIRQEFELEQSMKAAVFTCGGDLAAAYDVFVTTNPYDVYKAFLKAADWVKEQHDLNTFVPSRLWEDFFKHLVLASTPKYIVVLGHGLPKMKCWDMRAGALYQSLEIPFSLGSLSAINCWTRPGFYTKLDPYILNGGKFDNPVPPPSERPEVLFVFTHDCLLEKNALPPHWEEFLKDLTTQYTIITSLHPNTPTACQQQFARLGIRGVHTPQETLALYGKVSCIVSESSGVCMCVWCMCVYACVCGVCVCV